MSSRLSRLLHLTLREYVSIGAMTTLILLILCVSLSSVMLRSPTKAHARSATTSTDWPTYLYENGRSASNTTETILNPNTIAALKVHWTNQPAAPIASEPIAANGLVYWGSWDGNEHATDLITGQDVWTQNLGQTKICKWHLTLGVESTATITTVLINNTPTVVDIVGGGNSHLYALDANTGAILWQIPLGTPGSFIYSSPAVYNNTVYIGTSSVNDCPDTAGQFFQIDASTGTILNTFNVVPSGCLGGGVWSSAAIDENAQTLYISTGNNVVKCLNGTHQREPYAMALVALRTTDLSVVAYWKVPHTQSVGDGDFGSTPTLFDANSNGTLRSMVGLINKNGYYYAFDRTNIAAGPLWPISPQVAIPGKSPDIGKGSISSSAINADSIFVATGAATVNGTSCAGSVASLGQSIGTMNWQVCLPAPVLAPVTAVPGLIVVGAGNTMYVINMLNGQALFTYTDTNPNSNFWGAATISSGVLYEGNMDGTLYAFGL